jgi:hypothetical protein
VTGSACTRCGLLGGFYAGDRICKECRKAASRAYQAANGQPARLRLRDEVRAFKLSRGCADCGYKSHVDALEFDHLGVAEKKFDVSRFYNHRAADVWAEVAKCDVVCANCHRVRTAARRGGSADAFRSRLGLDH